MSSIHIKYYGAKWCTPCKVVKPRAEELCKKYGIGMEAFDYDELEEDEKALVTKLPTIQVWDGAKQVEEFTTKQAEQLETWFAAHVRVIPDEDF